MKSQPRRRRACAWILRHRLVNAGYLLDEYYGQQVKRSNGAAISERSPRVVLPATVLGLALIRHYRGFSISTRQTTPASGDYLLAPQREAMKRHHWPFRCTGLWPSGRLLYCPKAVNDPPLLIGLAVVAAEDSLRHIVDRNVVVGVPAGVRHYRLRAARCAPARQQYDRATAAIAGTRRHGRLIPLDIAAGQ